MPGSLTKLLDKRPRPAREFEEPLRPGDKAWHGRNGALRSDLGPMFRVVEVRHANGKPAVQQLEDGSGFALYPSGRKAICTISHRQSRRVSAIAYSSREFKTGLGVSPREGGKIEDDAGAGRKSRTRHLGAMNDMGIGMFESVPDQTTGERAAYEVSATHVSVKSFDGRQVSVARSDTSGLQTKALALQLKIAPEINVSYDTATGVTLLDFSMEGVQHTFHVGVVWRTRASELSATATAPITTPAAIIDAVAMGSQGVLDAASGRMVEKASTVKSTLNNTSSCMRPAAVQALLRTSSAPELGKLSVSEYAAKLAEGRVEYDFEHLMRQELCMMHKPLAKPKIQQRLRDGFLGSGDSSTLVRRSVTEPPKWCKPVSLRNVTSKQLAKLIKELESKPVLLVVLVVAEWAARSPNSSCAHARAVCEAAYGAVLARRAAASASSAAAAAAPGGGSDGGGEEEAAPLRFVAAELAEAGAIHSEGRAANPLVKLYGVKDAPWMLMFRSGRLVYSGRPRAEPGAFASPAEGGGGLGFASRLRYPTLARPRWLIVEPNFKLQLETQDALRRLHFEFDLAINVPDGRRMASAGEPPYGLLVASSEVGAGVLRDLAGRLRQRCPTAVSFVCHDRKSMGSGPDEEVEALVQGKVMAGLLSRPLTKSQIERQLAGNEDVRINYPVCGVTKECFD